MSSNKFPWTNRYHKSDLAVEVATLEFIDLIHTTLAGFDYSAIAHEFSKLPDIKFIFNNQFIDLSQEAKIFFNKLNALNSNDPLTALKIITILTCVKSLANYNPKLTEVVYGKLKECLLSDNLHRPIRLEWGAFCWKNWVVKYTIRDRDELIEPMLKLFIEESSINPEYALAVYDSLKVPRSGESYIFNQYKEDPEVFLLFARNVRHIRPHIFHEALMRFIRDGKLGFGGYVADKDRLMDSCNELFEITQSSSDLAIEQLDCILDYLILYSYPELPWYYQLHELLWKLENSKAPNKNRSIRNHLVISVNASKDFTYMPEVCDSYRVWLNSYRNQEWLSVKAVINHTKEMLEFVNYSSNVDHPILRNRSFASPNNNRLIEETIRSFWEMIEYLEMRNYELFLYALETAFEKPTFTVDATADVAFKARHLFILAFKNFCHDSLDRAATLATYMIGRTGHSIIGKHISEVLNVVYPVLFSFNPNVAKNALREGLKYEHEHNRLWHPKN